MMIDGLGFLKEVKVGGTHEIYIHGDTRLPWARKFLCLSIKPSTVYHDWKSRLGSQTQSHQLPDHENLVAKIQF